MSTRVTGGRSAAAGGPCALVEYGRTRSRESVDGPSARGRYAGPHRRLRVVRHRRTRRRREPFALRLTSPTRPTEGGTRRGRAAVRETGTGVPRACAEAGGTFPYGGRAPHPSGCAIRPRGGVPTAHQGFSRRIRDERDDCEAPIRGPECGLHRSPDPGASAVPKTSTASGPGLAPGRPGHPGRCATPGGDRRSPERGRTGAGSPGPSRRHAFAPAWPRVDEST